jgi:gliding motility-associated-like protein
VSNKQLKSQEDDCTGFFFSTFFQVFSHGSFGDFKKLSTGETIAAATFYEELRVIKVSKSGEVAWQKSIPFPYLLTSHGFPLNIFINSKDEIFISALDGNIFKMSKEGNLIWSKYKPNDVFGRNIINGFGVLPDGDWILWINTEEYATNNKLVRMSADLSKIIWIKEYEKTGFSHVSHLMVDGEDIIFHGYHETGNKKVYRLIKIDPTTGNASNTIDIGPILNIQNRNGLRKSKNGYLLWRNEVDNSYNSEYVLSILDNNLLPQKSAMVDKIGPSALFEITDEGEIVGHTGYKFFKLNADFSVAFCIQNYMNPLTNPYYSSYHNGVVTYMSIANNLFYVSSQRFGCEMVFHNMDLNGNMAKCFYSSELNQNVEPRTVQFENIPFQFITATNWSVFRDTTFKLVIPEAYINYRCPTKITCDEISIQKYPQTVCTNQPELFSAKRNPDCTAPVKWRIVEATGFTLTPLNDSAAQIVFSRTGNYKLIAETGTCLQARDTIEISVKEGASVNLGQDKKICTGDSLLINAGDGYPEYQWQNNSNLSTFTVRQSGTYYVTVTDACSNKTSDTIKVEVLSAPPLSAGNDSSVCIGNSFNRKASEGFTVYQWKDVASQQILSNQKELLLTADADRQIALRANSEIGCIRHDTITLKVLTAKPFDLGPDRTICSGDTVVFSAPQGYANYTWSNGTQSSYLLAWQTGVYALTLTDNNGCEVSDSVKITNIFALPQPNLGPDKSVCVGSRLALNPGNFARYQWQDGSSQNTFIAAANGTYFVQVWDANNCTAADTMQILEQLPIPAGFLAETDSLCQYEKLILQHNAAFKTYLWSTGSTQPNIQVDKPGLYALQVTDNNDCSGTDTIRVIQKNCMEGVYIPGAFTPNNDAVNDAFRPLVFGLVITYEFNVYNRFGERMFVTNEIGKGWDGTWKGKAMPANTYAWMCTYHLQGGEAKVERGMVTLIR